MGKRKNSIEKIKKKHPYSFFIVIIILVVSAFSGYLTCKHLTKNDKFEIVGKKEITITIGQKYIDEGAIAISFGKDISSHIIAENNIDYETVGTYYIKYYINNIPYKNVFRYRYIHIVEVDE